MTQFERDFEEMLYPLIVGRNVSTQSSEGHMTSDWETEYEVDGMIQNRFTGRRENLSDDTQTESDYLVLLPLQTSSGENIQIGSGYEVQKGSSYSSEVDKYEIIEHEKLADYVLEARALRFERG